MKYIEVKRPSSFPILLATDADSKEAPKNSAILVVLVFGVFGM
jgi:hypothetical protein